MIKEVHSINDMTIICQISRTTWPICYREMLTTAQIEYMLDLFYTPENLLQNCVEKGHRFFMYYQELTPIGFASIELNHQESLQTKLHKLYVLPHHHKMGAGRVLLEKMEEIAREVGQTKMLLHVNRGNPAIQFYEKMGFELSIAEDFDIGNGYFMNDFRMLKTL